MRPTSNQLSTAALLVASVLDVERCWVYRGRVWFGLGDGWHLVISPDDAGRFRLEACNRGRLADTLWVLCDQDVRLRELALAAREAVVELVG